MTDQQDDSTPELPSTTAEVLERIRTSRAEFEVVVAPLADARLVAAGPDAGWSIKDHIAHLTAWEQIALGSLRGTPEHVLYGVDERAIETLEINGLNDLLYRRDRAQTLPQVLEGFRNSHAEIVSYITNMTDADLQAPLAPDDDRPRGAKIAGDTYEHYAEHTKWIRELL